MRCCLCNDRGDPLGGFRGLSPTVWAQRITDCHPKVSSPPTKGFAAQEVPLKANFEGRDRTDHGVDWVVVVSARARPSTGAPRAISGTPRPAEDGDDRMATDRRIEAAR